MTGQNIPNKILNWYDNNKRDLPWRKKVSKSQMSERAEIRLIEELKNKAIDIVEAEINRRKTSTDQSNIPQLSI